MDNKDRGNFLPEIELLKLAANGIDTNLSPSDQDFRDILDILSSSRLAIMFKWFWKHSDVDRFANVFKNQINPDNLYSYISKIVEVTSQHRPIHWIERINLFHSYGLCRLINDRRGLELIQSIISVSDNMHPILTLSELSAHNVALLMKCGDTLDSLGLLAKIKTASLLSIYGAYQVYYYDGFENLLNMLISYKDSPKQVIIPQTIAGIFLAEPSSIILSKLSRERIYDEILNGLPIKVITTLEKLDNNYEISIKA